MNCRKCPVCIASPIITVGDRKLDLMVSPWTAFLKSICQCLMCDCKSWKSRKLYHLEWESGIYEKQWLPSSDLILFRTVYQKGLSVCHSCTIQAEHQHFCLFGLQFSSLLNMSRCINMQASFYEWRIQCSIPYLIITLIWSH